MRYVEWFVDDPIGRKLAGTIIGLLVCMAFVRRHHRMDERKKGWEAAIRYSQDADKCRLNADSCGLQAGISTVLALTVLLATIAMWIWL